jgi:hypothetical protein
LIYFSCYQNFPNYNDYNPIFHKSDENFKETEYLPGFNLNISKQFREKLVWNKTLIFIPLFSFKLISTDFQDRLMIKIVDAEIINIIPHNILFDNYISYQNLTLNRLIFRNGKIILNKCSSVFKFNIKVGYAKDISVIKMMYQYDNGLKDELIIKGLEMTAEFGVHYYQCKPEQGANKNKEEYRLKLPNLFPELYNHVRQYLLSIKHQIGFKNFKGYKDKMILSLIKGESLFVGKDNNILDWKLLSHKPITLIPFIRVRGILIIDGHCCLRLEIKKAIVTGY